MENKFQLIGAGVSLAIGISILACGGGLGNNGGQDCTFDEDCTVVGQVCSQDLNICEPTCIDDFDCATTDERCLPRGGAAQGNTCQFDDTTTNNITTNNTTTKECTTNEDCLPQNGLEGVCFENKCDYPMPDTTYRWIMIQDQSSGDAACDQTDPGSDIMGVRLLDGSGQLLGWGSAGADNQGSSGSKTNRYEVTTRLDGSPNGLSDQSCPESGSRLSELMPPPYSTGCGGWVLIEFTSGGTPQEIAKGSRIEVLEYGSTCGGSNADRYGVYLCTDSAGARGGSNASCTFELASQQEGFGNVTLSNLPQ